MTNQEIYDSALRLASEVSVSDGNEDYVERSPYLLAVICSRYSTLDVAYRAAHGLEQQKLLPINQYPLATLFPLSDIFSAPVSTALAALLVLEENPNLSQQLTKLSEAMIADIQKQIPFQQKQIVSHYAF